MGKLAYNQISQHCWYKNGKDQMLSGPTVQKRKPYRVIVSLLIALAVALGVYGLYACSAHKQSFAITPEPSSAHKQSRAITPEPSSSGASGSCPVSTPNTPDGPDPWGGCFPGPQTTGVPAGTQLTTVSSPAQQPPYAGLAPDNQGWIWDTAGNDILVMAAGAVINRVALNVPVAINTGSSVTIENSSINGFIRNDGQGSTTIIHSTIHGGAQDEFPTVGVPNVVVRYSNLSGSFNEVNCEGNNCDVEQSYLHGQYDGGPLDHNGGFFADGNNNDTLVHNSVVCTAMSGACTADVTFVNHYPLNGVKVQNNLLMASPGSYFCAYPGPNSATLANSVGNVSWIDNVFQRGANGKCGYGGPVYGWFPSICTPVGSCIWTGNRWDDGTALDEP
jgi:hypothetical protein